MEVAQSGTNQNISQINSQGETQQELLNLQQEQWITFCALGGLITEESDDTEKPYLIKQMPISTFAQRIGVPRRTLYNWKRQIPDFAERVRSRRYQVWSLARETAVFNRLFLIGMTGKGQPAVDALKTLAGHFSKLDLPVQRNEVEVGENLLELWKKVDQRRNIEADAAEII